MATWATVASGLVACGAVTSSDSSDSAASAERPPTSQRTVGVEEARAAVRRSIDPGNGSVFRPYEDLAGLLASRGMDAVLVGSVVDVQPDRGFDEVRDPASSASDPPSSDVVAFDDPRADWRTVRVTVRVDRTLTGVSGGSGAQGRSVTIDWPLLGGVGRDQADRWTDVAQGLRDLGPVLLLTSAEPDEPAYLLDRVLVDPPYSIATIAEDGGLDLPLAPDARTATRFLDGLDTVSEVEDALRARAS